MGPPYIYTRKQRLSLIRSDIVTFTTRDGMSEREAQRLASICDEMRVIMPNRSCAVHQGHSDYPPGNT